MTKAMVFIGQSTAYEYRSLKRALEHYARLKLADKPVAIVSITDHAYYIRSNQTKDVAQRYDFNEVSQYMASIFTQD